MKRFALLPALCLLLVLAGPAPAGGGDGFFTERELSLIDEALALLNMDRADLEFDKLVIEDDWRLPVVDRTLSKPLDSAEVARDWAGIARGEPDSILVAARRELEAVSKPRGDPLSDADRERLVAWAYDALVDEESHDGLFPKPEGEPDPEEMLALAARADVDARIREAVELLRLCGRLGAETRGGGDVRIGGPGDDVHDLRTDPPRILVDLGGNDRYLAPARATPDHPVAIVIDLSGDDVYGARESLSCGAGLFGVGILWDRGAGDDEYRGGNLSQGCGLFGVGVLVDEGGNDVFRCRDTGQGAGAWGVGLLLDRGDGNDSFHADLFGQGFAYVGGLGLLHGEKGQDVYEAGGVHLHYPLFNDRYQSLSQGFSIGMRPYASGGIGLLVDDAGNDRYACDIYGQGASYWFAYGALVDGGGNDTYNLGQYGQGGGIHLAVGCLIDLAGQDLYYNMHGVGTGGAHDFAVGILVDREGDDYYAGSGGTMGGALTNSFAMLLDAAGNDGYSAVKVGHSEGGGRPARGMGSIGLLLDLDGDDLHGTRHLDGASWTKETYGAGIDLPTSPPPAEAPPARPHLAPEEVERRIRERAWDEEKGAFDLEKLWEVACEWAVGEMADIVPRALEHLHALGDPAFEHALSLVGTRRNLEDLAVSKLLALFGERSVPPLVEMLEAEDWQRRVQAARFLADLGAISAVPALLELLDDPKASRTALDSLARLDAREHWEAVVPLVEDAVERTRVTAIRCLERLGAKAALPAILGRMTGDEVFTVRFAAEDVAVSFGHDAVAPLLELAARGDHRARRHAIRALGRIASPDTLAFLVAVADDPEWTVRHDAAAALARYLAPDGPRSLVARQALEHRLDREENPHVKAAIARALE